MTTGRGGLGTIFVWAAGNGRNIGDQGNKDGIANSMYALTVGAVANNGNLASYSETGSHLAVVAPTSGGTLAITTTDLTGSDGYNGLANADYTNSFGGTSAATPVVAGVVALMLEANPALNWRDVKEILLRSSTKLSPSDGGWVTRTGGYSPTLPVIKHHESFGGGLINAQAAIDLAKTWSSLAAPINASLVHSWPAPDPLPDPQTLFIPDNNSTGITIPFDFTSADSMRVEHVQVTVNINHTYRGDLQITLRSPSGVVSTLATKELEDDGLDYYDWTFSSMRHWGESARGIWQLSIKDLSAADDGYITSASVVLHGSAVAPAQIISASHSPLFLAEGDSLALSGQSTGDGHVVQQWFRGASLAASQADYSVASVTTSHAGAYRFVATNLTGTATSQDLPVGIVRRTVAPVTVNEGATVVLNAVAAGPGLSFQWFKNGATLPADIRISGAHSSTLTLKSVGAADQDSYTCLVTMAATGTSIETLPAQLTVRLKPVIAALAMTNGVVSGIATFTFAADDSVTKFTATGVPPGMTFNTKTGVLSGRPTTAKTYNIKVTATNAVGTGPPLVAAWTIEPFPLLARGVFNGLVARHDLLNGGLGGKLTLTVATSGSLSGTITLGPKTYRFTGRVNALPGGADPSAQIFVKRTGLSSLSLDCVFDLAGGSLAGTASADGQSAVVGARRNPWHSTNKALNYAASYNAFLQAEPPIEADPTYPQGQGYAVLKATPTGGATWAGKLADGTALTGGTTFGAGGEVPLHLMAYTGTGSLQGWSSIDPVSTFLDGQIDWLKKEQPAKSATRSYKPGFPLHLLTLIGSKYTKPPQGTPVIELPVPVSGQNNARLSFTSEALPAELAQALAITATNSVKMPSGSANAHSVRLTLNAATGLISGGFTLKDNDPTDLTAPFARITRAATFAGVLITRPGYNQGRGHCLLPLLPDLGPPKTTPSTSPIRSGQILLQVDPE